MTSSEPETARGLLSAAAVRDRAHQMLAIGEAGGLEHWRVDMDRLPETAAFVAGVVRDQYPDLKVPFHARWRHFVSGGHDLWADLGDSWSDPEDRARAAFDLAITSVLLDAGSGPGWKFIDPVTELTATRSEGLAVASFRMFEFGAFSSTGDPLRADAASLSGLTAETLAWGFGVSDDNPLIGLDGRAALLRRLGDQATARPDLFALKDAPRPGGLFDAMAARAEGGRLPGAAILDVLLEALGPMWENRPSLGGVPLGDCWPHPAMPGDGFVPLHKLSQWLSYSLVEPLQAAGVEVVDLDGLTGLAEYRNGGLFMDKGVLVLKDSAEAARAWPVDSPLVVGWRSMTVALLDRIAPLVRAELGVDADAMPLASVLEGGTWAAGRRAAAVLREGGGPPLTILSDGTVF